jgi:HEAT repeats
VTRQSISPEPGRPEHQVSKRLAVILALAALLIFIASAIPSPIRAAWDQFTVTLQINNGQLGGEQLSGEQLGGEQVSDDPQPASPAKLSDHEIEEIAAMSGQKQAERLLERAINHYEGALELLDRYVQNWYAQLELQGQLTSLITTALNSNDLRVRAAAVEVELAGYNLPKRTESVDALIGRIQSEPSARPWALWMLGLLGNRSVETQRAFTVLMDHRHDPDEQTRYWAVEGLSMLGIDESIAPLLEAFRSDPSPLVRERGGCGLAQSGMLSRQQRLRAVPDLLQMTDDKTLDATTRGWVFQALRDITGASVASDPAAWRDWWAHHARG